MRLPEKYYARASIRERRFILFLDYPASGILISNGLLCLFKFAKISRLRLQRMLFNSFFFLFINQTIIIVMHNVKFLNKSVLINSEVYYLTIIIF